MLHQFLATLNILYPVFVYMALGKLLSKRKHLSNDLVISLNRILFRVLLPVKLYIEIIQSDFRSIFNPRLIIFTLTSVIVVMVISIFLVSRIKTDRKNIPVIIQGTYRSNYIMYGVAIASTMYPGKDLGVITVLAAFTVPLFNLISVIVFELFNGNNVDFKLVFKKIFSNNIVRAGILGLTTVALNISLPKNLLSPFIVIGNCSTPIGLMCIGTMVSFESLSKYRKELFIVSLGRLVIVPLLIVPVAVALNFRNMELAAAFILFSGPIATSSCPMAYEMGGNGELAGVAVAVTSTLVLVTIFIGIFILKSLFLL